MTDFATARVNMVECQIMTNKVTDERLLDVLQAVPREVFVPKRLSGVAYRDDTIEVGDGREMMAPLPLARLLQAAEIKSTDAVLEIGTATGYAAAVMANLADTVVALESNATLAEKARKNLEAQEAVNAVVVEGDLAQGLADQGPFDVIFINGMVEEVPAALKSQLTEGGRLVALIEEDGIGRGTVITRMGDTFADRCFFDAFAPRLDAFYEEAGFVF